jgi:serine/threonine-protein kinase
MGEVYAARHTTTGREVALKVIRSADRVWRFTREARAATAIRHPHVVEVYDLFDDDDGTPVMVMELLHGETFAAYRDRLGTLTLHQTAEALVPVLRAVREAHAKGIVHRDLKPDNIFLAQGPSGMIPKVLDFGIAKVLDPTRLAAGTEGEGAEVTKSAAVLGTPRYMSLEQAMGEAVDSRADVWSIGVIVFEALTGRRPLVFDTLGQMFVVLLRGDVPAIRDLLPDLPADVAMVVDQCLAKSKDDRLGELTPLIDALARHADPSVAGALAGGRVVDSPGALPSAHEARRDRRRGRRLLALAAGGSLCAIAVAVAIGRAPKPAATAAPIVVAPMAPGPRAVTDAPMPPTASADALLAYEAGLRSLRDGTTDWDKHMRRAAEIDPGLAAAHLRLALATFKGNIAAGATASAARSQLAQAVAARHALSHRDLLLLGAAQSWMQSAPPNAQEFSHAMRDAQAQLPQDAEIAFWTGVANGQLDDLTAAVAAYDRATELDPEFGGAYDGKIIALMQVGNEPAARAAIAECMAHAPGATACLEDRKHIEAMEGQCEQLERTARDILTRAEMSDTRFWLASAGYALGRPAETARELFDQQARALTETPSLTKPDLSRLLGLSSADILSGDFDAARDRLGSVAALVAAFPDQRWHALVALLRSNAALESGRPLDAGKIAMEYLRRRGSWAEEPWGAFPPPEDLTARLLLVARSAGLVSREDFEKERRGWLESVAAKAPAWSRPRVWVYGYAAASESADDAIAALAEQPSYGTLPPFVPWYTFLGDAYVGRAYVLAGRASEALPYLRHATRSCMAVFDPFEHTRARLSLGEALGAIGENDEACAAYGEVLARWGRARPRSVTAERARALRAALRCPSSAGEPSPR